MPRRVADVSPDLVEQIPQRYERVERCQRVEWAIIGEVRNRHTGDAGYVPCYLWSIIPTAWVGELWLHRIDPIVGPQLRRVAGRVAIGATVVTANPEG